MRNVLELLNTPLVYTYTTIRGAIAYDALRKEVVTTGVREGAIILLLGDCSYSVLAASRSLLQSTAA